jgi:hypothetical protein
MGSVDTALDLEFLDLVNESKGKETKPSPSSAWTTANSESRKFRLIRSGV